MLNLTKINHNCRPDSWCLGVIEFRNLFPAVYEKVEKQPLALFWDRPRRLLVRHSASKSEMLALSCHVFVVIVEQHMLPLFSCWNLRN